MSEEVMTNIAEDFVTLVDISCENCSDLQSVLVSFEWSDNVETPVRLIWRQRDKQNIDAGDTDRLWRGAVSSVSLLRYQIDLLSANLSMIAAARNDLLSQIESVLEKHSETEENSGDRAEALKERIKAKKIKTQTPGEGSEIPGGSSKILPDQSQ